MISEIIHPAILGWAVAIEQSSSIRILLTIAYMMCSGLSLVCQYIDHKKNIDNARVWRLVTIVSFFGFMTTIFQPEILVTDMLRNSAKLNDWYYGRQVLQFLILGIIVIASLKIVKNLKIKHEEITKINALLGIGMCAVFGMFILRLVSFHYTDLVINARVLGISIGRMVDFAGVTCTSLGIIRFMFHKST